MNIRLHEMNQTLARRYFRKFVVDPALFLDSQPYQPYQYTEEKADAMVERYRRMGRVYLAVMLGDEPIGEVVLKNIDRERKHCTMGISLINDSFKNKGYGTAAEKMILKYAFEQMEMRTVYADSLITNLRSQHVLQKVGFAKTGQDDQFVYFQYEQPRNQRDTP